MRREADPPLAGALTPTVRATGRRWAALFGILVFVFSGLAVVGSSTAQAEDGELVQISEGTVTWGIKESWRDYIGTSGTTLDGGVSRNADGTYDWPVTSGSFDDATNSLRLDLAGSAHYRRYENPDGGYILDSLFKDLYVVISPTEQVIRGTYSGNPREGGDREEFVDIVLATIDITSADFAAADGQTTWHGANTFGGDQNGLYPPGTPFDPVSISYAGPGGIPDTGERFETEGAPVLTPGNRWIGDNTVEDGRAVFASQRHDVLHVVERSGFGTPDATYVLRVLDATTMEVLGRTDIEATDARQWFQVAFDPATDTLYLADGDPDSTGAQIRRAAYARATHTYGNTVIAEIAPIDTSTSNEVSSMTWDTTRDELIVFMKRTVVADRRFQGNVSFVSAPETGSDWAVDTNPVSLPDAGKVTGDLTSANGFSGSSAPASRFTVLRDGSYLVVPGGNYRKSGSTERYAIPAMHLTRDEEGISLSYVEGTAPPPISAQVATNYEGVATAADGGALMYGRGTVQYVDLVDGHATPLTGHRAHPDINDGTNAVGDPTRGVDYVFYRTQTQQLTAWVDHEPVATYRFDDVNRGGLVPAYPLTVAPDGAVILLVKDPSTGNIGLQRFDLEGVTPTVTGQPGPQTVNLTAGTSSEPVTFSSTFSGGTGDVTRQWQVQPPGATGFTDLAGETAETLTIAAQAGMDGTRYRAVYINDAGKVASQAAPLTVKFAPRVVADPGNQTITEGTDAVLHASFDANPRPTLTWQRRVGGHWQPIDPGDDNFTIETTDGVTTLTVIDANTDQTGTRLRVRASNDIGTVYSDEAVLTVAPAGSTSGIEIAVTVPDAGPGEFVWAIDGTNRTVELGEATQAGDHWAASGELVPIVVSDTRAGGPAWSISGQVSDFTGGIPGSHLGWTPAVLSTGAGAMAGDPVPSGFTSGDGLSTVSTLASTATGHELGTATVGAELDLRLPVDVTPGSYTATLTLTALS